MTPPTLHVLADGGPGVGAGHVGRCLALAQAWVAAHGRAVLVGSAPPDAWAERYSAVGIEVVAEPAAAPDVLVVDGYRFWDAEIARRARGAPVVSVDDHGVGQHRGCALVVDQNLGATGAPYGSPPSGVLAGTRYALLRREVVAARPAAPADRAGVPHRIGVAVGGDPPAATLELFEGAASALAAEPGLKIVELRGVRDLGPVLAGLDLALTAAGSTVWELALFGVPTVAVAVADNQIPVARRAGAAGLVVDAGDIGSATSEQLVAVVRGLLADPVRRTALAAAGRAAVDGRGAQRVATAARSLLVHLRRAAPEDADQLWRWANDDAVRAASFHPEPIPWDDHVAWFQRLLASDRSALWLASDPSGALLGQFRVDLDDTGRGTVDVSVDPARRGEGWAGPLIAAAARRAATELQPQGIGSLGASVLLANEPSSRAFLAADFDAGPDGSSGGREHRTYTRAYDG